MATLKENLLRILEKLKEEELKKFKWFLEQDEGFSGIPAAQLEKAERETTVDLMVQTHTGPGALKRTLKVLEKIRRNDLVQRLQTSSPEPTDPKTLSFGAQKEEDDKKKTKLEQLASTANRVLNLNTHDSGDQKKYEKGKADLKSVQLFAVDVTLDPETAHPHLILSGDEKQVHHGDVRQRLPYNPKRFKSCVNILGKQSLSSGRFYFEVQVKGKTDWTVGVVTESINRKNKITLSPENGFWTFHLDEGDEYMAVEDPAVHLSLKSHPQKVGVFVDYEKGLVSFYDVDTADQLYSFTDCSFTEKLYPFFSPCTNDGGRNSAPLIICPVKPPLNIETLDFGGKKEYETKKAELKSVQQFAVDVTLDPETAHPALFLSDDGKQVHDGDVWKKLQYNSKRFKKCVNVLGKQSLSSGRFYFEVQVKGKTAWTVGVATESIDRKEDITLSPEDGFWTVWLRDGNKYDANDENPVCLSLKSQLQRVGVFVDYEKGLVSFYDVDTADLLYSFTGCSFTEKIYPFFSPCTNDGGRNSAPLIICPINHNN